MKQFKKIGAGQDLERVVDQLQENVGNSISEIVKVPILDGNLITEVSVSSGSDIIVNHKLNRKYRGYIITRKTADLNIWESSTTNNAKDKYILIQADTSGIVDIWFF